ncbi:hypothetical protein [Saliniramus sp.]|uniref:hypothetical protein n=1 Tax=Saliniramus sp. TaxID=2986772 RepID=UPI002C3D2F77|nr:hypothetical protein [Saliniramus sp.]HMB12115.1 hypothetical protein [Saliniramus sp.]
MIHHAESRSKRGFMCVLGLACLVLAGCNTPGQPEPVDAGTTGGETEIAAIAGPQTPDTTCGRAIDDFAGLLSRDLANGMVAQRVHDEAMSDLEVAASACRAGSQDQALSALRATRIRHGYPTG